MSLNPEISIVVPMYNAEKFIELCIGSILAQTFQNFEVVIVDDCSTDRSLEIVKKEYSNDPRIKVYRQLKNSGDHATRNLGLINSQGKYVYFMDSDDVILENTLEVFYNAIEESGADVVHMNSYFITEDDFTVSPNVKLERKFDLNPTPRFLSDDLATRMNDEFLNMGLYVTPWKKISRRDFLIESGLYFPLVPQNEDLLQLFGELCFAKEIQVIDACCYIHRIHPKSKMKQSAEVLFRRALKSLPTAIDFAREVFSSPKTIFEIPRHAQDVLEVGIVFGLFTTYMLRSYRGELTAEQINEILHEVLYQPSMMNPEVTRVLINALAACLISK